MDQIGKHLPESVVPWKTVLHETFCSWIETHVLSLGLPSSQAIMHQGAKKRSFASITLAEIVCLTAHTYLIPQKSLNAKRQDCSAFIWVCVCMGMLTRALTCTCMCVGEKSGEERGKGRESVHERERNGKTAEKGEGKRGERRLCGDVWMCV